jgi:hypothetical protein
VGGTWVTSQPQWEAGKYYWERTAIWRSDGTLVYLGPVLANGLTSGNQSTDNLDSALNQQGVFNRLTNNGQTQGIYLSNGLLYINGTYIQAGTINANLLRAGIISDLLGKNTWNLETGAFTTKDGTFNGSFSAITYDYYNSNAYKLEIIDGELVLSVAPITTSGGGIDIETGEQEPYVVESIGTYVPWGKIGSDPGNAYYDLYMSRSFYIMMVEASNGRDLVLYANSDPTDWQDGSYIRITSDGKIFARASDTFLRSDFKCTGDALFDFDVEVTNDFTVHGVKSRIVETDQYSNRLLYCYETPSPMFGDIGEGVIGEDGLCYISLDPVFAQTITTSQYQVFLQKYGNGDAWVMERKGAYFIVKGTPGIAFGWEIKAKQKDFDQRRLDKAEKRNTPTEQNYGADAAQYIANLMKERVSE